MIIDDNAKNMEEEIKLLKTEVAKLKTENFFRIEALSRVHLLNLEDIKTKHNKLWKGYRKEVKELEKHNEQLRMR